MTTVDALLPYFRYYRDEILPKDFSWWYCLVDHKVYETADVCRNFHYASKEEICSSDVFVEFYKVDVIELKKDFLTIRLKKREWEKYSSLPDKEFDISFNGYIEIHDLVMAWYEFEKHHLQVVFSQWVSDNKISI